LSRPQGHSAAGRIRSIEKSNEHPETYATEKRQAFTLKGMYVNNIYEINVLFLNVNNQLGPIENLRYTDCINASTAKCIHMQL
jgi:hypothetical protein